MGFWDSLGRSVKKVAGLDSSAQEKALKAQMETSKKQAAAADAERQKIKNQEDAEKARLNEKQMRSLKRKFGGSGLMGSGDNLNTTLGA